MKVVFRVWEFVKSWGEQLIYVNSKTGNRNWKISLRKKVNNKCDSLKGACKWCYWHIWPFFSFSYLSIDIFFTSQKFNKGGHNSEYIFNIFVKITVRKLVLCKQIFFSFYEDFLKMWWNWKGPLRFTPL